MLLSDLTFLGILKILFAFWYVWLFPLAIILFLALNIRAKKEKANQDKQNSLKDEFQEFQELKKVATNDEELQQFLEWKKRSSFERENNQDSQRS